MERGSPFGFYGADSAPPDGLVDMPEPARTRRQRLTRRYLFASLVAGVAALCGGASAATPADPANAGQPRAGFSAKQAAQTVAAHRRHDPTRADHAANARPSGRARHRGHARHDAHGRPTPRGGYATAPGLPGDYGVPEIGISIAPQTEHWYSNYLPDSYRLRDYDGRDQAPRFCRGKTGMTISTTAGACPKGQHTETGGRTLSTRPR